MKYFEGKGFLPVAYKGLGRFDEDKPCDLFPPENGGETTYYFSEEGSDGNDGLSPLSPKKSVAEAERLLRAGGVRIAFRGGDVFAGGLRVFTEGRGVTVCSYGRGRAVFRGGETAVNILSSCVTVENIEVTGAQSLRGICVSPIACGPVRDVVIRGCYVHDVNFAWDAPLPPAQTDPDTVDVEKVCPEYYPGTREYWRYNRRSHGGIIFLNDTDAETGASWFENIFILDNRVENVARTGIYLANVWADKPGVGYGRNTFVSEEGECVDARRGLGYFMNKNVVCSGNRIVCAGGDGAILSSVWYAFMEKNVCLYANYLGREGYWNAGLWVFDAHDVWMRGNESGCTYMRHGSNDAQGFDIDNACTKVVFKNNYAHHNEGGGLLVCNKATDVVFRDDGGQPVSGTVRLTGRWYDNLVCCNVFEENGNPRDQTRAAFITVARETDYLFAYSNVVIMRAEGRGQSLIHTEDKSAPCYRHFYVKNIFTCVRPVEARLTADMLREGVFEGNAYINTGGELLRMCNDRKAARMCKRGFPKKRGKAVRTVTQKQFLKIIEKRGIHE